ncbi:hypothetical protein EYZ11_010084 [Aspergillus tanneri]|nr:hypothetical protein EYZ11_010084 [Aspergillus tanneri]
MVGFVVQFIGLRDLHASVILAQMGSTLLMTIVRTCLRTKRISSNENQLQQKERQLTSSKNQELDSFAFFLEDVESFSLISTVASGPLSSQSSSSSPGSSIGSSMQMINPGTQLIQLRTRLAELTSNAGDSPDRAWDNLPIRKVAQNLAQTIETTMDLISSWKDATGDVDSFELSFVCQSRKKFIAPKVETYAIMLERSDDTLQWHVGGNELEAILGLRTWSLLRSNSSWLHNRFVRLVGLSESEAKAEETDLYFHKWIFRHTEARMASSKMISFPQQMFGYYSDEYSGDKDILVVKTENELELMVAQDMYIHFLASALKGLKEIRGDIHLLPASQNGFLAHSDRLDELVNCFESSEMGSREDALLCIVPVLRHHGLLPKLAADSKMMRVHAEEFIVSGNWPEAFAMIRWFCERCEGEEFEHSIFELGYLCRRAMVHTEPNVQSNGFRHVSLALEGDPRVKFLQNAKIPRRGHWMDNRSEHWEEFCLQLGWMAWHIAQKHCDKQSLQGTLYAFEIHEHSVPPARVNSSDDQGRQGEQIVLEWLTNGDEKLFARELPGIEDRLALDWVCQNGHHALMNWLIARWVQFEERFPGFIYSVLLWAAEGQYRHAIASLRRRGVNIDMQDSRDGITALINKIVVGDRTAVCELLEAGADVNGRDTKGATPLMTASHIGDMETVSLLLRKGASINAQDHGGLSPLIWSTAGNYVTIAQTLLEHGSHVNLGSFGGNTPLISAAAENHVEMVRLFLSQGAHVNAQTGDGCTALMLAARNHCTEAMKVLLDHGADINSRNRGGRTALDLAREVYHLEGVQLLESALEDESRSMVQSATES